MRQVKAITEEPWKTIISEEWKRAKSLIGQFHAHKKPTFYWDTFRNQGNKHGYCNYRTGEIHIRMTYLRKNIHGQDFLNILRHEIVHILVHNHGNDFTSIVEKLGGTRYATYKLTPKKKVY